MLREIGSSSLKQKRHEAGIFWIVWKIYNIQVCLLKTQTRPGQGCKCYTHMRLENKIYDATSTPSTLLKRRSFHEIIQRFRLFSVFSANASVSPYDIFVIIQASMALILGAAMVNTSLSSSWGCQCNFNCILVLEQTETSTKAVIGSEPK